MKASKAEQLKNLDIAMRFVDNLGVAVDVGANIGEWTAKMAGLLFDKIFAFEPGEDVFEELVKLEKIYDNVWCFRKAVGNEMLDSIELVSLQKKINNSYGRYIRQSKHKSGEVFINNAPMVTIDSLNLNALDLLKIDVEGAEVLVLQGAMNTVLKYKPVIIVEDSSYGKRYGYRQDVVDNVLKKWGARQVAYAHPDKIFKFDKGEK